MLDFLAKATIADVAEKTTGRTGGPRKQRNPEGLAIRVFRDGSVFPSTELIAKFNLEYKSKGTEAGTNGFDVIDTDLYPSFEIGKRILIILPTSKTAPKVDLFGSTTYDEAGAPKSSVLDQGSKTFGMDDLIPSIEAIYGITFFKPEVLAKGDVLPQPEVVGVEYVDMVLVSNPTTNKPWGLPNGKTVTYIPKKVSRGADKGTVTTIRRENPEFYAFLPAEMLKEEEQPAGIQQDVSDTTELIEETEEMYADAENMTPVRL
jgi:hypothetical protein